MATASADAGFWPAVAAAEPLSPEQARLYRPAVARLAAATSPALADWLLGRPSDDRGPLIAPEEVRRSRLLNRFTRAQGVRWLGVLTEAGIEVVCLKGMAACCTIYPDPDLRGMSDVDLLVRGRDIQRLVTVLAARGFVFKKAQGTPRWGLIGDASFHPFVAPDGAFSIDLHVEPDDYPLHRGLSTEAVFAHAHTAYVDGLPIRVPSGPHFLLLALANAARDKLGPEAVKSVVDAVVYLARTGRSPDWDAILAAARRGGFLCTVRAMAVFLERLGVPRARLPQDAFTEPRGLARKELARAVADFAALFPTEPDKLALQRREIFLLAPSRVVLRRYGRRLLGLIRPWPGIPDS